MKILHTSDWHIGKKLYNKDLEPYHKKFFDWMIKTIEEENIELLIVAGDIFDLAFPSNSSLKIYYETLTRLRSTCCKNVIITSGNHDSVSTLNAPKEILKFLNVYVVGGTSENIKDEIIEIKNELNETKLVVCAVPFLRDRDIRISKSGENYQERIKAIRDGIVNHYEEIAEQVKSFKEKNIPVIATAHLFTSDATMEKLEEDIYIGGLQQISSKQFPEVFDYIALGHVHRAQIIGGNQNIRYCGCPIHMSFSDRNDSRFVTIVDFNNGIHAKNVQVPQEHKLIYLKGSFQEIEKKIAEYKSDSIEKDWAEIDIIEEHYDSVLIAKVNSFIENLSTLEALNYKLIFKDKTVGADELFNESVSLKDIDISEVFEKLIDKQGSQNKDELLLTFHELLGNLNIE